MFYLLFVGEWGGDSDQYMNTSLHFMASSKIELNNSFSYVNNNVKSPTLLAKETALPF